MKTCRMCRWAEVCDEREERLCGCPDKAGKERVRAGAPRCEAFQISAWCFLESVAQGEKKLEDLSWRAQHYREMAGRATGSMEAARSSGTAEASKLASNCDRMIDIAIMLDDQAAALKSRIALAERLIADIQRPEERRVLELRHSWCRPGKPGRASRRLSWEEIAREMGYDESNVRRIHRRALEAVQAQMELLNIRE